MELDDQRLKVIEIAEALSISKDQMGYILPEELKIKETL